MENQSQQEIDIIGVEVIPVPPPTTTSITKFLNQTNRHRQQERESGGKDPPLGISRKLLSRKLHSLRMGD